jgi:hypothetical protein
MKKFIPVLAVATSMAFAVNITGVAELQYSSSTQMLDASDVVVKISKDLGNGVSAMVKLKNQDAQGALKVDEYSASFMKMGINHTIGQVGIPVAPFYSHLISDPAHKNGTFDLTQPGLLLGKTIAGVNLTAGLFNATGGTMTATAYVVNAEMDLGSGIKAGGSYLKDGTADAAIAAYCEAALAGMMVEAEYAGTGSDTYISVGGAYPLTAAIELAGRVDLKNVSSVSTTIIAGGLNKKLVESVDFTLEVNSTTVGSASATQALAMRVSVGF